MSLPFSIPFFFLKPVLHAMDAETAHSITIKALKAGLMPRYKVVDDPRLHMTLWDRKFHSPLGLSAGFDKNAEVIAPMLQLGFGFVEAGGVTCQAQGGLPKPRIFRDIPNQAIINKMNFPNVGIVKFKENITKFLSLKPRPKGVLGVQIAVGADQKEPAKDFIALIRQVGLLADYIVFNISCPNTPGLQDAQRKEFFDDLASQLIAERDKVCGPNKTPLIVKLSPDLDDEQLENLARACVDLKIDGVTLTNTTRERPDYLNVEFRTREGGLSGQPVTDKSTQMIHKFYALTNGKIPIIGVGGISNAQQAYDKIRAGASLLQLYTALVYQGPEVVHHINIGLIELLEKDGFEHISQVIGADHF